VAKGDPGFPLEYLTPYFNGARWAAMGLLRKHRDKPEVAGDAERYFMLFTRYAEDCAATYKLQRERGRNPSRIELGQQVRE
jgi:hypothetical protein